MPGSSKPAAHRRSARPDIVVETALGTHLFRGETDRGREWLQEHFAEGRYEWVGKLLSADGEQEARDLVDAALADGLDVLE